MQTLFLLVASVALASSTSSPQLAPRQPDVWINEVHHSNTGPDTGEGVEIAGPSGTDLSGYRVWTYSGYGTLYAPLGDDATSVALAGPIDDEGGGLGAVWVPIARLRGGCQGLAVTDPDGGVVEFVSTGGCRFNALDGPVYAAAARVGGAAPEHPDSLAWSTGIQGPRPSPGQPHRRVQEWSTLPAGHSIQLAGAGAARADFDWTGPLPHSPGRLNDYQAPARQPNAVTGWAPGDPVPPGLTPARAAPPVHPQLDGPALRAALRADLAATTTLGYGPARDSLYTYEQRASGAVCGVYTAFCVTLAPGADASTSAFQQGVNAEHAWPQSRGTASEPQRSDLHGLFPARAAVNSARGNHPYAEIPDRDATAWYRLDAAQSTTPRDALDEWSERAGALPGSPYAARFEPREDRAGDIARAVAYIATQYEAAIDAAGERRFLATMLPALVAWNAQDPPDDRERARSAYIASLQGHGNPFLDDPTLLARALADYAPTAQPDTSTAPADVWINEIHYDNAGADTGEFVELAGPAGLDLTGWRLVLYNGNGGAVYDETPLAGTIPDQALGIGTARVAYPVNGLQNGPDAVALVTPSGAVAQFLAYEGVVMATAGPADGLTARDVGVAETGSTPAGRSLQLVGDGRTAADFAWSGPAAASPGALNAGQSVPAPVTHTRPARDHASRLTIAPNPTAGRARATLVLGTPGRVVAVVYDALGRRALVAFDGPAAGTVQIPLDTSGLAPGVYVLRATTPSRVVSRTFTVTR